MSKPTTEMLDAYFEELSHADKEAERTWYKAGIAAYTHLCSPASEQWKKEHGFMEDGTMKRDEMMMNAAEAYAAGLYADKPVSFSTEEDRCVTMNDFCAGWREADSHPQWIPVEEELPNENGKTGQSISVWATNGLMSCEMRYNFDTKKWTDMWGDPFDVTHWMPLPQPPRKEE